MEWCKKKLEKITAKIKTEHDEKIASVMPYRSYGDTPEADKQQAHAYGLTRALEIIKEGK